MSAVKLNRVWTTFASLWFSLRQAGPPARRRGPGWHTGCHVSTPETSGILWYMVVQDSMYQYEPVRTLLATWQYEKPQNGKYQYVLT
jgi:hypothetical protein